MFEKYNHLEVVAQAGNGAEALEAVEKHDPDIITLDVVMPVMDGLTTLKHIMIQNPRPTIMLSSLTIDGAETTFDAFRYGAIDFIPKAEVAKNDSISGQGGKIIDKVTAAANVDMRHVSYIRANSVKEPDKNPRPGKYSKVVVIGAAEGSYSSMMKIIPNLMPAPVAYLLVFHESPDHVSSLAKYLDKYSQLQVKYANNDEKLMAGVCYVSSGWEYTSLVHDKNELMLHVGPAPFSSHRGSIDRTLFSAAETMADKTIGVILGGAGKDGVEGLVEISNIGGKTIVQDPKSCLIKEMPQTVIDHDKVDAVIGDAEIAGLLNKMALD